MLNWKMAINCVFAGGEMSRLWVSQGPQDKMDIYDFLKRKKRATKQNGL